jgi:hypothetical protein
MLGLLSGLILILILILFLFPCLISILNSDFDFDPVFGSISTQILNLISILIDDDGETVFNCDSLGSRNTVTVFFNLPTVGFSVNGWTVFFSQQSVRGFAQRRNCDFPSS